jgi:hypothetical protein
MEILINDFELYKECQTEIAKFCGNKIPEYPEAFPIEKSVCFGERYACGAPHWVVVLYNFKERHDCMIDLYLNVIGVFTMSIHHRIGRVIADYAFKQAGLKRITSTVRASNKRAMRVNKLFGFQHEGVIRSGYLPPLEEDMHLFGMLRDDCKWLQES